MKNNAILDVDNNGFRIHLGREYYAMVRYQQEGKVMHIVSTRIPDELQGRGYGKIMMESVLPLIEQQGLQIVPVCSYVKHYLDRHPEWQHLRFKA